MQNFLRSTALNSEIANGASSAEIINLVKVRHDRLKRELGEEPFLVEVALAPLLTRQCPGDESIVTEHSDPCGIEEIKGVLSRSENIVSGMPRNDSVAQHIVQTTGISQLWTIHKGYSIFYEYNAKVRRVFIQLIVKDVSSECLSNSGVNVAPMAEHARSAFRVVTMLTIVTFAIFIGIMFGANFDLLREYTNISARIMAAAPRSPFDSGVLFIPNLIGNPNVRAKTVFLAFVPTFTSAEMNPFDWARLQALPPSSVSIPNYWPSISGTRTFAGTIKFKPNLSSFNDRTRIGRNKTTTKSRSSRGHSVAKLSSLPAYYVPSQPRPIVALLNQ